MNDDARSNCTQVFLLSPWDFATGGLLSIIDVVVFVGNMLVIAAALTFEKLKKRGVTNIFITSLAVSDLLLSVAVLPFSIVNQVMHKQWIFGPRLCRAWLVVDVLCCTASILNLVLIASDRFFAIKHPIRYPKLMTLRRARILVALSWLLAFGISFPPMLQLMPDSSRGNCSHYMECSINQSSIAYIIYSASGSFFLPAAVMLYFYMEIYRAVRRTIQNVRRGEMVLKSRKSSGSSITSDCPDTCVLRVHLGGSAASASNLAIAAAGGTLPSVRRRSSCDVVRSRTSGDLSVVAAAAANATAAATSRSAAFLTPDYAPPSRRLSFAPGVDNPHCHHLHQHLHLHQHNQQQQIRRASTSILPGLRKRAPGDLRLKSIYNETKAARMLAVIGVTFTVCWLPFFSVYVLGGFCDRCVPEPLFDVFFWMGYCNSAINPYVYALLSRDFREAFRLLLCRLGGRRRPATFEPATVGRQSIRILINDDQEAGIRIQQMER